MAAKRKASKKKAPKKVARKKAGASKKRTSKKAATKPTDPIASYRAFMGKHGVAEVSALSNDECVSNIPGRISTGSIALDGLLHGEGEPDDWFGIPLSRITEIYGPPHVGKSTLLDIIFGNVQAQGGIGVLADTERSRDRAYTARFCDTKRLHYLEYAPEDAFIESVLDDCSRTATYYRSNFPDMPVVIGWDALGSTATRDEMDKGVLGSAGADTDAKGKVRTHKPGAAAKAMALAQRIVAPRLGGTKIAWVFLNHEYDNINAHGRGPTKKSFGGNAPKHMASVRIQLFYTSELIKRSDGWVMGRMVGAKLVKSRHGNTGKEVRIPIITGVGVENLYTVFSDFKKWGIVVTSGSWSRMNLDGQDLAFQGWFGLKAKTEEHPELREKLLGLHKILTVQRGGS